MNKLIKRREEGQGLVEYALVLVLIAIVVILILTVLGSAITVTYARIMGGLYNQVVPATGDSAVVLALPEVSGGPTFCTYTISSGTTVIPIVDGAIVETSPVTIVIDVNGATGTASATVNGNGVGTLSGDLAVTDSCGQNPTYTVIP